MGRMPMLKGLVCIAALVIAGCKQEREQEPARSAGQPEQSAGMPKPLPGLYRSTAEMISLEAPGLPPGAAAQMQQRMAGKAAPADFCLTAEEASRGYEERVKKLSGRTDCDFDHYSAAGGKLDARLTCTSPGEGQAALRSILTMQGTTAPEGSDVTLGIEQSGAQMPGGSMKLVMRVKSARVGDCPEG